MLSMDTQKLIRHFESPVSNTVCDSALFSRCPSTDTTKRPASPPSLVPLFSSPLHTESAQICNFPLSYIKFFSSSHFLYFHLSSATFPYNPKELIFPYFTPHLPMTLLLNSLFLLHIEPFYRGTPLQNSTHTSRLRPNFTTQQAFLYTSTDI